MIPPQQAVQPPQIRLVLTTVFLAYLSQMTLNPIIAPLARKVGLAEWQLGVTISTAAVMVVLSSSFWGRRSQSWGTKPVLLSAFALAACTMTIFALTSWWGMAGQLGTAALFLLFILSRGVGFGTAIGAVSPTAQAYIADTTEDGPERVKGMAGLGASQGLAMVIGSSAGGLLAGLGLIVPVAVIPVVLLFGLVLIAARLRPTSTSALIAKPAKLSPLDSRIWPFLLAGLGMFTALGFIQVLTGFVVQDRFGLSSEQTGMLTGGTLLAAGLGMVCAQAVIVPKTQWPPNVLLRVGTTLALVGFALYIPSAGVGLLIFAMLLVGVGLGIALPGFSAGPTMRVSREEQGGLAGLSAATSAVTFIIAPALSTALYGLWPPLPLIVSTCVMTLVCAFVYLHPSFTSAATAGDAPTP